MTLILCLIFTNSVISRVMVRNYVYATLLKDRNDGLVGMIYSGFMMEDSVDFIQ